MNNNALDLAAMKVLLVDDTPANIDVLKKTLQPEGYEISIAPNGKIALSIVDRVLPDLILLDVMMPELDGFETCRRLKEKDLARDIPVIFITAKTETEDIVKGFGLGGVDYIAKPFRQEEVCARVRTHLQLRASMKQVEMQRNQLEAQNKRLAELDAIKNKFIGMAAHDIRNPLTSMLGFSQLLVSYHNELPAGERKQYLSAIHSSSEKMLALVNNLLDLSVIESGNLKLVMRLDSLEELCRERVHLFGFNADKKSISLKPSIKEIGPVPFDKDHISQVFDNLISNAIKFSPQGSTVYISVEKEGSTAKVSVRDEGPGISVDDKARLFGAFEKLSAKPTAGEKSTGLGLAIVKKIVEAHGGAMCVESELGSGTTFSFSLPVGKEK